MSINKASISKKIIITATTFFMVIAAGSAKAFQVNGKPYRSQEFSINTPGQLKVRTSGGAIKVTGSKGPRVRVEMYVSKHGKNLTPSDTQLKQFEIQIKKEGNTIVAS